MLPKWQIIGLAALLMGSIGLAIYVSPHTYAHAFPCGQMLSWTPATGMPPHIGSSRVFGRWRCKGSAMMIDGNELKWETLRTQGGLPLIALTALLLASGHADAGAKRLWKTVRGHKNILVDMASVAPYAHGKDNAHHRKPRHAHFGIRGHNGDNQVEWQPG